jgi:ADP-heptose:LPS heptosyltransferase
MQDHQQSMLKKLSVSRFLIKLNYYFLNSLLNIFKLAFFNSYDNQNIKKVLIFRVGELGDNLCAIPAINMIRSNFQKSEISILSFSKKDDPIGFESLLSKGIVDNFIDINSGNWLNLLKLLKFQKFNLVIELPQNMSTATQQIRNILFFKLCGIPFGFGWEVNSNLFLKRQQYILLNNDTNNETDRLLALLKKNRLSLCPKKYPINIKDSDISTVDKLISKNNLNSIEKNIVLVIGAKIHLKEWSVENFVQVANYFIGHGYKILLIGGKGDIDKSVHLMKKCTKGVFNFSGVLTPVQSMLMIKNSRLTLTNDTGPMHMSACVGTPIVALFSSWSYDRKWYPDSDKLTVIRKQIECSICYNSKCADNQCMKKITVNEVISAMEKMLIQKWGLE